MLEIVFHFVCLVLQIDFWIFFDNLNLLAMLFKNIESKIDLRRAVILMLFPICSLWSYLYSNSNQILRDLSPKV